MFKFFQNKNQAGNITKKIFGGCLVLLLVLVAGYGLLAPNVAHAGFWSYAGDKTAGALVLAFTIVYAGFFIPIAAFSLWLSAELLEMVIKYSVLDIHKYIGSGSAVATTWEVLRDFGNMFFIFILLYTAIMTILGLGGGNVKKVIVRVVIFALLINFSFFFTKIAIDASNIVSIGFYKQIVQAPCGDDPTKPAVNIGGAFMCHLGLTNFFSANSIEYVTEGIDGASAALRLATLGSAVMFILAIILAAAGIMFLVRFVTLLLLLVFSPLAFAAMALPNDKYSSRWTKSLIDNCIAAPAFMMMTWIVLKITAGLTNGQNGSIIDVITTTSIVDANGQPGFLTRNIEATLNYFIVAAMMIATILVAKEFGAAGAGGAIKALNGARGWAQGIVGRNTIGRAAKFADDKIGKTAFGRSWAGQELRAITTKPGVDAKFGSKRSVKSIGKEIKKNREEFVKSEDEAIQKDVNKNIGTLRGDFITESQDKLKDVTRLKQLEAGGAQRAVDQDKLEKEIARLEKLATGGIGLTPEEKTKLTESKKELGEINVKINADSLELDTLRTKTKGYGAADKIEKDIKATEANRERDERITGDKNKGFATSVEMDRFGNKKREDRIKDLTDESMRSIKIDGSKSVASQVKSAVSQTLRSVLSPLSKKDRENVREELAKKVLKIGQKDLGKALKDAAKAGNIDLGGGEGEEGGEGKPEGGSEGK